MTTSYGIIVLKTGQSGMVHLLKPVCFKGGLTHYSIAWKDSGKREQLTSENIESFTYCSI
jgi:hypothetical protein